MPRKRRVQAIGVAPMGEKEAKGFTAAALATVDRPCLPEISNNRQNHLANFTAINKGQSRCSNNHAGNERVKELHKRQYRTVATKKRRGARGFPQQQVRTLRYVFARRICPCLAPHPRCRVNAQRTTDKESRLSHLDRGCRNRACYKALTIRAEAWLVRADHPRLGWICRKRVCIESDRKQ